MIIAVQICEPVPGALWPCGTGKRSAAFGGVGASFGVDDERSVLLAPRVPLRYALPRHTSQRQRKETHTKSV